MRIAARLTAAARKSLKTGVTVGGLKMIIAANITIDTRKSRQACIAIRRHKLWVHAFVACCTLEFRQTNGAAPSGIKVSAARAIIAAWTGVFRIGALITGLAGKFGVNASCAIRAIFQRIDAFITFCALLFWVSAGRAALAGIANIGTQFTIVAPI